MARGPESRWQDELVSVRTCAKMIDSNLISHCLIEQLPNELLTRILSELDQTSRSRCAQLSRRWHQLTMQPLLWRSLRIRGEIGPDLTLRLTDWLSGLLLELHADRLTAADLAPLLRDSPGLQSLSIEWLRGDAEEENPLETVGLNCRNLRSLRLLHCTEPLTPESLKQLLDGCPHLSKLELVTDFRDTSSLPISHLCSLACRLTSLSLSLSFPLQRLLPELPECRTLSSLNIGRVSEMELRLLLNRLPHLAELILRHAGVTDSFASVLTGAGGSLRALWLHSCHQLTGIGFCALLDGCPKLQRLSLFNFSGLSSTCFRRLADTQQPTTGLTDLQLEGINWRSLTEADLATQLPTGLRRLVLKDFTRVAIPGLWIGLGSCSELAYLTLSGCHDALLPVLLAQLPRLRSLRLTNCHHLSCQAWANLRSLAASPPDLHEFHAEQCSVSSLTDASVADLCASPIARSLRRLKLDPCRQLTAAALASIASGCPQLSELSLQGCRQMILSNRMILDDAFAHFLTGQCLIEQLPNELLTRILSELDQTSRSRCAQLNRRWYQLALQPLLWRSLRIDGEAADSELTQRLSGWLGASLEQLLADGLTSEHRLPPLLAASSSLTSLTLHEIEVSDCEGQLLSEHIVTELGRCCKNLRELRLLSCQKALTIVSLDSLYRGCPSLSLLAINDKDTFTDWKDQRLRCLLIKLMGRLTSLTLSFSKAGRLLETMPECQNLASLSFGAHDVSEMLRVFNSARNLTDLAVQLAEEQLQAVDDQLLPAMAQLRRLNLKSTRLDADFTLSLITRCPSLRSLRLKHIIVARGSDCRRILKALPAGLIEFRVFIRALKGMDEADLSHRLPCDRLRRLQLKGPLDSICGLRVPEALSGCSGLTDLTLGICHDELLPALLSQLPRLRCLRLINCSRLTQQAWANLRSLNITSQPDLHEFCALGCGKSCLTDEAVTDLCASPVARSLRCLSMSNCDQLTAAAFSSIVSGCPWLTRLTLVSLAVVIPEAHLDTIRSAYVHQVEVFTGVVGDRT